MTRCRSSPSTRAKDWNTRLSSVRSFGPTQSPQVHKELLFHDRDDPEKRLTFDLRGKKAGAKQHQDWQSEEVRAEELRLLYVALTRAMNRCYIYLPGEKTDKSPLAHLFESSTGGSLFDQVTAFAQSSKGCVSASSEPGEPGRVQDETALTTTLQSRLFNGKISKVAMTASFSGLNVAATELEEVDSVLSNEPPRGIRA